MEIIVAPDWFFSFDVMIEFFSFLILSAFFVLSLQSYKVSKKKNSLYLGVGFLVIALAEIATILSKFVLYFNTTVTKNIGGMILTYHLINSVNIFYYLGTFFHKFLVLGGLYIIYKISEDKFDSGDFLLAIYFIFISSFAGNLFYYLFHITALTLLAFIISNYSKIYKSNKSKNTKVLIVAFSMLAFSHLIFILSNINFLYITAKIIQLASYLILLVLIIRILKYPSKN
jgi:hypothetical protein